MVIIKFKPNTMELEVKGHANYGKKGSDIVCAAVSALFYTLGENLHESREMLEAEPVFKDTDGIGYISCVPKKEYEGNVALIYRTVLIGLQAVSESYKENVSFRVEE